MKSDLNKDSSLKKKPNKYTIVKTTSQINLQSPCVQSLYKTTALSIYLKKTFNILLGSLIQNIQFWLLLHGVYKKTICIDLREKNSIFGWVHFKRCPRTLAWKFARRDFLPGVRNLRMNSSFFSLASLLRAFRISYSHDFNILNIFNLSCLQIWVVLFLLQF